MPVKSLIELATGACLKHIKELDSVGDYLPYETVRRILLRVDNAYQLRQIELNSPQIEGRTAELWLRIIEREFPLEYKATAYKPQDSKKWHKVWEKYKKQHDKALQDSENKLKSALAGLQQHKEQNLSKLIERKDLPRVPKKKKFGPRETSSSTLRFAGGSRTKTNSGASVMRKVRREVQEIAKIHGVFSRPSVQSGTPSFHRKQIAAAPQGMLNDYRRAAQPSFRKTALVTEEPSHLASVMEEFEKRATVVSDSDEERQDDVDSNDEEGDTELFDEPLHRPPPSQPIQTRKASSSAISLLKHRPKSSVATPTSKLQKRVNENQHTTGRKTSSYVKNPSSSTPEVVRVSNRPSRESRITADKPSSRPNSNRTTSTPPTKPPTAKVASRVRQTSPQSGDTNIQTGKPRTQSTLHSDTEQSPPPPNVPNTTESSGGLRKRKAVDIFMRPRKK